MEPWLSPARSRPPPPWPSHNPVWAKPHVPSIGPPNRFRWRRLLLPCIENVGARAGAALRLEGEALVHDVADAESVDRFEETDPVGDIEARREVLAEDERRLVQAAGAFEGRRFEAKAGGETLGDQVAALQAQRGGGVGEEAPLLRRGLTQRVAEEEIGQGLGLGHYRYGVEGDLGLLERPR